MMNPDDSLSNDSSLVVDGQTAQEMRSSGRETAGIPWSTYERYMADLRNQPSWRQLADKCSDYYDCNQLTNEQIERMEANGQAPIVANIVRPVVDVVLGMEAKTRQDFRVSADAGEFQDVAEAESFLVAEAERESKADRACSDAYSAQIKAGLGWVEVARSQNPFEYKYRAQYIHRREIWWDWRDTLPDLPRARFLLRKRWQDLDEVIAAFPQHQELLEHLGSGRITFNQFDLMSESQSEALANAHQRELRTTIDDLEWRDTERNMLCLTEFWYRTWHRGIAMRISNSNYVLADPEDPVHQAIIASGKVKLQKSLFPKIRLAWWVGPHQLADIATNKKRFPYIPFWGFREDRTGIPYGLIRPMLDPQDEYNARRSKLMWLLSAKRVQVESDALDTKYNTLKDLAREVNRPDQILVLDPQRNPRSGVKVDTDFGLASQQFEVMHDAEQLLQKTAGVYQAMMGQTGAATSGLAINSLVEQGATTLAEINDNYRFARRLVGESLLDLIREDIGGERAEVSVGSSSRKRKIIVLNDPQPDGSIKNDVLRTTSKLTLADVPSTPSYRAQQLQMLGELTKSLPPQLQAMIIDFVIAATDLQNRDEIVDRIRSATGIKDPAEMTPEEKAAEDAKAQADTEKRNFADMVQARIAEATAAEKEARAAKTGAEAERVANENDLSAQVRDMSDKLAGLIEIVGQIGAQIQPGA